MNLTVKSGGLEALRVLDRRRVTTEPADVAEGHHDVLVTPYPFRGDGNPWVVLVEDKNVGLPLSELQHSDRAVLSPVFYAVLAPTGWRVMKYADMQHDLITHVTLVRKRCAFIRRLAPSGNAKDPVWLVDEESGAGKTEAGFTAPDAPVMLVKPLFPPNLRSIAADGTRWSGPAVRYAQERLQALWDLLPRESRPSRIQITGVADDAFIEMIRAIQAYLFGFGNDGVTGDLDEDTLFALKARFGFDFRSVDDDFLVGQTTWIDADGSVKVW